MVKLHQCPICSPQGNPRRGPHAGHYQNKDRCSRDVPEKQPIQWTTYNPQGAYLLQCIHNSLIQGHKRNRECVHHGIGVYAVRRIKPASTTPLPTTEGGAQVHAYQATSLLPQAARGAALALQPDETGQLRRHHLTGTTFFGTSSQGEVKTLAIIVDAVTAISNLPQSQPHHVWVVIDAAVDFQILRRLTKRLLHTATDSSLGTQALHL